MGTANLYEDNDYLPSHTAHHSIQGIVQARFTARTLNQRHRFLTTDMRVRRNQINPHGATREVYQRRNTLARLVLEKKATLTTHEALLQLKSEVGIDGIELQDLGLEVCENEQDQLNQLKRVREMACPIATKRVIRNQLLNQDVKTMSGYAGWKYRQNVGYKKCNLACRNVGYKLQLWGGSFKQIEGHFGTGVLSYFLFLKWLFLLDVLIFVLLALFIAVPQASFGDTGSHTTPCVNATETRYLNIETMTDSEVQNCTAEYTDYLSTSYNASNYEVIDYVADFFQGTGWMEKTVLFYGYYSSLNLEVSIQAVRDYVPVYNLSLAYIVVTGVYFIISLVLMVRQSAKGFKDSIVSSEDKFYQFCNKMFGTWDFALSDPKNVVLKKKSVYNEIRHDLQEQKDEARRTSRSTREYVKLWCLRIAINIFVIAALGGSGYLIIYSTQISSEIINTWAVYKTWNSFVQLIVEFLPSATITAMNIIVPFLFEKIVLGEDYRPGVEVKITLIRTVFLRLASLAVLFAAIYVEVTCSTKNDCGVGTSPCQPLHCWETYVGQQLYKLVVLDLIVQVAVTVFVEFPRKLIVLKCSCKLAKVIGYQQFIITKNVLDLVYSQTLCWLGAFFSPLIPAVCVIKFFIVFYIKKLSLLSNFVPNERPYRASRSNSFFVIVLLISFILCCFPIVYVMVAIPPSRGCGPFRPYAAMYDSVTVIICDWPHAFQQFLTVITSVSFNIPVFIVFSLTVYYQHMVTQAQVERVKLLKDQLLMEGRDKQFLVAKLNEVQGKSTGKDEGVNKEALRKLTRGQANQSEVITADEERTKTRSAHSDTSHSTLPPGVPMEPFYQEQNGVGLSAV